MRFERRGAVIVVAFNPGVAAGAGQLHDRLGAGPLPVVGLGATRVVDWAHPEHPDFVVLSDADGNEFCVIDLHADDA